MIQAFRKLQERNLRWASFLFRFCLVLQFLGRVIVKVGLPGKSCFTGWIFARGNEVPVLCFGLCLSCQRKLLVFGVWGMSRVLLLALKRSAFFSRGLATGWKARNFLNSNLALVWILAKFLLAFPLSLSTQWRWESLTGQVLAWML